MDFKVIWTDSAIDDLKQICEHVSRDNPVAAEKVGRGILGHIALLERFPHIGPPYPRGSSGNIREIVYGKYRIFYETLDETMVVHILRVWHGARGAPELR
jgi:plasmid stabilization system protein ParE